MPPNNYLVIRMKLFTSKKGIELSINFIVMLIIGIAMFGFGLKFLAQFFSGAEQIKSQLDTQTKTQIQRLTGIIPKP